MTLLNSRLGKKWLSACSPGLAAGALLWLVPAAAAQTAVAPPPQPPSSGPSLQVTMQFIQDKLGDVSKGSYIIFSQNTTDGSTFSNSVTYELSNIVADQNQCRISFHQKNTFNGRAAAGFDVWFTLHDVQDIVVKPMAQYQTESDASMGQPNLIATSTSPLMTLLLVRHPHGVVNSFPFTDADLADRVAKALTHAVELCGGGNTEPF